MEYKISKVGFFSKETYGRDNNHRVMVQFEGQEKEYSAFVQEKPNVGDVWNGELKKVEKNDKIFHNFEFAKAGRSATSGGLSPEQFEYLKREIVAIRQEQVLVRQLLQEKGVIPKSGAQSSGIPYPESDVNPEDLPF